MNARLLGIFVAVMTFPAPSYAQQSHDNDNIAECKFAPFSAPRPSVPTISLAWQFNTELMGIFGPDKIRVLDPGNLLGGRQITRIMFKNALVYFAATQAPAHSVDESALIINMITTPKKSGALTSTISSAVANKLVPKFIGNCVILPFKHGSDKWFESLQKTNQAERGQ